MMPIEDGFISGGLIVWADKRGKTTVTRGLELYGPAMESLSVASLHRMEDAWRVILRMVPVGCRMQFRYSQYTDYRNQLLAYYDATQEKASSAFAERQRNERFTRYAQADEEGQLKAARCRLFVVTPIHDGAALRNSDQLLQASSKHVDVLFGEITRIAERLGGHTKALDDEDLFEEVYRAFHPGAKRLDTEFIQARFRPENSILESCLDGDVVGTQSPVTGFYHAEQYHGCLVLSGLPQTTHPGMITALTSSDVDGFGFTVNLEGRDVTTEIENAESIKAKLEQARRSGGKNARLDQDILVAGTRVQRLSSGAVRPMRLQLILQGYDTSLDGLQTKLSALRNVVTGMGSARTYEMALPTSCRNFFFAGLPGAPHFEPAFWHLLDDHNAANLLPVAGDSAESLEGAEALYQG